MGDVGFSETSSIIVRTRSCGLAVPRGRRCAYGGCRCSLRFLEYLSARWQIRALRGARIVVAGTVGVGSQRQCDRSTLAAPHDQRSERYWAARPHLGHSSRSTSSLPIRSRKMIARGASGENAGCTENPLALWRSQVSQDQWLAISGIVKHAALHCDSLVTFAHFDRGYPASQEVTGWAGRAGRF